MSMLGDNRINQAGLQTVKELFDSEYCTGIIGGVGNRAMYIIGYCNDDLLVLDPHSVHSVSRRLTRNTSPKRLSPKTTSRPSAPSTR